LAGRNSGYYQENGQRILVSDQAQLPEPKPGSYPTISKYFSGLLKDGEEDKRIGQDQLNTLFGWIKIFVQSLYDDVYRQGQALALAGPEDCGKSVAQQILTLIFGGRCGRAAMFLNGKTTFNDDLLRAEHLFLEDDDSDITYRGRTAFGNAIKRFAVNRFQDIHPKNHPKRTFELRQRLSITLNYPDERLQLLPPFTTDVGNKIILLRCSPFTFRLPVNTAEEQRRFWHTIASEIPAFIHDLLHEFEIPLQLRHLRYGVASYHHPELAAILGESSRETIALALIEDLAPWNTEENSPWTGTSVALHKLLLNHPTTQKDTEAYFKHYKTLGAALGQLARTHKSRVQNARKSFVRLWTIYPPQRIE